MSGALGNPGTGGDGGGNGAGAGSAGAGGEGGGGGTPTPTIAIPENWKEALPEEFRKDPSLEAIKTVEDLSKSYIHAQKMVGKDKVVVPDPKFATDKDWAAFFQKAGLPADVKDYKITPPKDAQLDEKFFGEFAEAAHKLNILPNQAQKLLEWYVGKDKQMMDQARESALNEVVSALDGYKKEVGAAFQKKLLFANKTLEHFGGAEVMKYFHENPSIGNNPKLIEMFSKIGEKLFSEDTFDGKEKVIGAMSPDEARTKRNEIMGNPQHPYWIQAHPEHQNAVEYVNKLFEYENPA